MKKKILLFALILSLLVCSAAPAFAADYDLLMGDLDDSKTLTASDARAILRASVSLDILDEDKEIVADVTFNGSVAADDARLVLRASVGLEKLADFYHTHTMQPQTQQGSCTMPTIASEVCAKCGYTQVINLIPAPGHSWTDFVRTQDGHYRTCTLCSAKEEGICELVETINIPATCTTEGYIVHACICGRNTMQHFPASHAFSSWTKNAAGNYVSTCSKCSETKTGTPEAILNWFNTHVNSLKTDAASAGNVTALRRTKTKNIPSDYSASLLLAKEILDSSLRSDNTVLATPAENRAISDNILPAMGEPHVSDLTMQDIKSIDVAFGQTVNVLNDYPASFTLTKTVNGEKQEVTYDVSDYKNTAAVTDAIKVTININDETATKTGVSGTTNVYTYKSGGKTVAVANGTPLVLTRFYGLALPDLCNRFPQFNENGDMSILIDCPSANSAATAEWYFDAQTLAPIACKYKIMIHLDQDVTLKSLLISGDLTMDSDMTYEYIFLFEDYYPCMAE